MEKNAIATPLYNLPVKGQVIKKSIIPGLACSQGLGGGLYRILIGVYLICLHWLACSQGPGGVYRVLKEYT